MKNIIATLLLLIALAVPAVAECPPGQTQGPPGTGCDGGGGGLMDPNGPSDELAPVTLVSTESGSDQVDLIPLAVETIRLAFFIW